MAEKNSSSKTLVLRKCETFQVTEDPDTERKKTPTSATTQNQKTDELTKDVDFFLLCSGVIKWEKLSQYMIASQSWLSTKKNKNTRWQPKKKSAQKKRKWKNRATLIVFERFKWIQAQNAFSFLSPLAGCFVFDGNLWRRPFRMFSSVSFLSENSSFVHGLYQFVSPHRDSIVRESSKILSAFTKNEVAGR